MTDVWSPPETDDVVGGQQRQSTTATTSTPFVAPESDETITPAPQTSVKGALSPEDDERARKMAADLAAMFEPADGTLFRDSLSFGLMQKMSGLMGPLQGESREFGEAMYQYYIDEARKNAAAPTASSIAGAVVAPGGPVKSGIKGVRNAAIEGGIGSGVEEANRQLPSEANIEDVVEAGTIGTAVSAGVAGVGESLAAGARQVDLPEAGLTQEALRGKTINEAADAARRDLGVSGEVPAQVGNQFAEEARRTSSELMEGGKSKMREATEGDLVFNPGQEARHVTNPDGTTVRVRDFKPGRQMQQAVSDQNYARIRNETGRQAIPITPQGTPAAHNLRETVINEYGNLEELSLKQWDQLRTRIRGLKNTAANETDRAAVEDLEEALEGTIQDMVTKGTLTGDAANWSLYNQGRKEVAKAFNLQEGRALREVLKDESVPGSAIADQFFRLDSPPKRKKAARMVADLAGNLGEDSEALTILRAGMLSKMFESNDPKTILRNVKVFTDDPELIGKLFDPKTADKLTELAVSLENLKVPDVSTRQGRDVVGPIINDLAQTFLGQNKLGRAVGGVGRAAARPSTGLSIATGAATGSPMAAAGVFAATEALTSLAKKPVRVGIANAAQTVAPAAGRETTQSEGVQDYMEDEQIIQGVLPRILEQGVQ